MTEDFCVKLYQDRTFADVTFVSDGSEEKAHKCVLADRCDYFKHYFREKPINVINVDGTFFKYLKQVVKFCYLQQIDIADWSYYDKDCLHKVATSYNYGPLMDFVQSELDKRPEVPLSVKTLNEWHQNSPGEELREWIQSNALNIVNYEDCHKYTKDLIRFILPVLFEMYQQDKYKKTLPTVHKNLLTWLFRWRDWSDRNEEDVNCIFSNLRLNFMSNEQPSCESPILMKLSDGVGHFMWFRQVKTTGWKRDEVLSLLCLAHFYEFCQLSDAVLNVVTTEYLDPSSFATLYGIARKLEFSKLEHALVNYLKSNTMSIFTSTEFRTYPASVVEFILENLSGQVMETHVKWVIFISMRKWRYSNSEKEVQNVRNNVQCQDFMKRLIRHLFKNSSKNDGSRYVTFVFDEREIKAHKMFLAYSCDAFKELFDQNRDNRIDMKGTRIQPFNQLVNYCYRQTIDLTGWTYSEKEYLYDISTKYNYQPLMDMVKLELDKRPKVPLSVESINEWYENSPEKDIREWVKNNHFNIVNYDDCHKFDKDLVVLIMDTVCELSDKETNKDKLEAPLKKLLLWLFRWRIWCNRNEDDVQNVFGRIRLPLVFKDRALGNKSLQEKLFLAVRRFCHIREVDTAGWTCDDVLEFLYFAHDYEFGPLLDAVVNVVDTQYLETVSLVKIHHLISRLQYKKLQQIVADYIQKHTMIILTSSEFTNYSASVVAFILENLSGKGMDLNVKNQLLTSLWKWKTSKSEDELTSVFTKIHWEDFSLDQLARVLRTVIPITFWANSSEPRAPADVKGAKRKQGHYSRYRRGVCPRKE